MSLACWQRKRDPSTLMLLFVVQKLGFLGGEARKLTFGQRIVNHLLGLSPPTYRYSVPVEFLLGSAKRDLLQPSRAHMKAGRSCSWGHVCSSYSVSNWIMGFGSLEKKKKNPISCLFTQIDSFACSSPNLKVWNSLCLLFRMYWCPVFDEGIKEMFIFNRRSLITGARELPVSKLENSGEGNLWSVYLILESSMSKQKSLMTWSKWGLLYFFSCIL